MNILCWLFGHKPVWERKVYQDRWVQQAFCDRCFERIIAIDDGKYPGTPAPTTPDDKGLHWGV